MLPNIKPIEKLKTMEEILFPVFHTMFTKKTHGIYFNLYVLGRKFSDFVPKASSALRNFPTCFTLAVRCPKNEVEISYQCATRFKKNS